MWLDRYQQYGLAGMEEQSRRPHSSPGRTVAEREQQVIQLRQRYPDWGARKLQVLLAQQGLALPASTIHRILLRHHLVRAEDRHEHAGAADPKIACERPKNSRKRGEQFEKSRQPALTSINSYMPLDRDRANMTHLCVTCGTQFPPSDRPPEHCPICEDERQFVGLEGQQWIPLEKLQFRCARKRKRGAPPFG